MDIDQLTEVDNDLRDGFWIGDLPRLHGVELLVRPANAPDVIRTTAKMMRAAANDAGEVAEDQAEIIDFDTTVTMMLLGWRGITKDGDPVEYSEDIARQWLQIGLFAQSVQLAIARATTQANAKLEGLAKNSQTPSDEKSTTA